MQFSDNRDLTHRPDATGFRKAAARFTTGVTVVGAIDEGGRTIGMTANSFVTVSLTPPIVLISLKHGRTLSAVEASGRYCVSVLGAASLDASWHFSGKQVAGNPPALHNESDFAVLPGALAVFACDVLRSVEVADHRLLIGQVRWCRHEEGEPLAFFGSEFCSGPGTPIRNLAC
ncbi:MAG: flavin reductase family protein [Rhizobiaceae bacterium]|nr:flavin reductase family protein [Rhizobiaceae bacterium]